MMKSIQIGAAAVILVAGFAATVTGAFVFGVKWQAATMPPPPAPVADPAVRAPHPPAPTPGDGGCEPLAANSGAARKPPPAPFPAPEFAQQNAVMVACSKMLRHRPGLFRDLVAAVHDRVTVIALVLRDEDVRTAHDMLEEAGLGNVGVRYLKAPLNTVWLRDYGPLFVRRQDNTIEIIDTDYSLADRDQERFADDDLPLFLASLMGLPVRSMPLRIAGGNLLTNGEGHAMTTAAVIRRNRMRAYSLRKIRTILNEYLGYQTWTSLAVLKGEPTGHLDMYAVFLATDLVVVGEYDPAVDAENARRLDSAARWLATKETSVGRMRVRRIPMPPRPDGHWRTYTNVIMVNGKIIVPTYSDVDPALQAKALDLYRTLLPDRTVVEVNADSLVPKHGLLHCVCINIPEFVAIDALLARSVTGDGRRFHITRADAGAAWTVKPDHSAAPRERTPAKTKERAAPARRRRVTAVRRR